MSGLLLPRTDAGVAAQVVLAVVVLGLALWRSWDRPDLRLLVIGLGTVTFALLGLRSAH
ncbi:MAG: hypothetical protein KY461_04600 [Actinobacteria bacterium]|nr:hypothetical protein [Actinomycetota bacterium]